MSFRVKMLKNVTHFLGNRTPQARRCYFSRVPHRESLQFSNFDVIDMQKLFVTMEVRTFLQNISSTESFKFLEIIRRRADFSLIYFLLSLEYIWKRADVDESHIERIKLDEVENFSELRKKEVLFRRKLRTACFLVVQIFTRMNGLFKLRAFSERVPGPGLPALSFG